VFFISILSVYCSIEGNKAFRETIYKHLNEYNSISCRFEKGNLFDCIVEIIRSSGGRFLKQVNQRWVVLDDREARNKVGHALRDASVQQQKPTTKRTRQDYDDSEDSSEESTTSQPNKRHKTSPLPEEVTPKIDLAAASLPVDTNQDDNNDMSRNMEIDPLDFLPNQLTLNDTDLSDPEQDFLGLMKEMDWFI
jgi:hypothetical protein